MQYIFIIGFLIFSGLYLAERSFLLKEKEVLDVTHVCCGVKMKIVKFQMGAGEDALESKIPSGYVHAGHNELTAFLEQNSSIYLPHILFAFRGRNSHESIKPSDEACMRVWDGRRELTLSENVLDERGGVFRGYAYALLKEF